MCSSFIRRQDGRPLSNFSRVIDFVHSGSNLIAGTQYANVSLLGMNVTLLVLL